MIAFRPTLCKDGSAKGETVRWLILEVDAGDLIGWLGDKAKESKSGKSLLAHGAIRVRLQDISPH